MKQIIHCILCLLCLLFELDGGDSSEDANFSRRIASKPESGHFDKLGCI